MCRNIVRSLRSAQTAPKRYSHYKNRKKKSPSPGIILPLSSEESWRKRGRVNERCEREGTGEEEEKDGERERDGGLSLRIYLSKTPTLRF